MARMTWEELPVSALAMSILFGTVFSLLLLVETLDRYDVLPPHFSPSSVHSIIIEDILRVLSIPPAALVLLSMYVLITDLATA